MFLRILGQRSIPPAYTKAPVSRASRADKLLPHIHHCMALQKLIQLIFESMVPMGRYLKETVVKRNFGHR